MQVTYELQLADWRASDRFFALRRKSTRSSWRGWWFYRVFLILFLLPVVVAPLYYLDSPQFKAAWKANGIGALWPLGIALIPLVALALMWFGAPLLQNLAFRESPFYGRQITLGIQEDGIGGDTFISWAHIAAVEESSTHIFLVLSDNSVFIIPSRAFKSGFESTQFAARCREGRTNV
ncbi:hypothetical protein IAD21_04929 [Abditibacteriota bacterium]|nr:hypothetical protein IAD21_04929 [Abditibacteriota bacterium]